MYSDEKLVVAGEYLHHYKYSKPVHYDFDSPQIKNRKPRNPDLYERNDSNIYRTKKNIKLLLQSNTSEQSFSEDSINKPLFLTFTFAENIQDVSYANKLFTAFIQRVNYQITKQKKAYLKYLNVIEFQSRGAIHYHSIFFNPLDHYQLYEIIKTQWPYGYTSLKKIFNQQHLINYVYKDLTKNRQKRELYGHKSYFTSKNLQQASIFRDKTRIQHLLPTTLKPTFTKTFTNDFQSTVYTSYKLAARIDLSTLHNVTNL